MLRPVALWPELLTILIAAGDGFSGWASLNDTIMGGRSSGVVARGRNNSIDPMLDDDDDDDLPDLPDPGDEHDPATRAMEEVAQLDPISQVAGGRRYSFYVAGSGVGNLFNRCFAREGRHNFVTGSRVTGPHVWLDSLSVQNNSDEGPHHRWATGPPRGPDLGGRGPQGLRGEAPALSLFADLRRPSRRCTTAASPTCTRTSPASCGRCPS